MNMTRDEILNMPAGRALDALIEYHIMKTQVPRNSDGHLSRSWVDGYGYENTFYSTDIAAAWDVVEKLNRDGWYVSVFTGHKFECALSHPNPKRGNYCKGETAPLAICRAALLAVQSTSPTHDSP